MTSDPERFAELVVVFLLPFGMLRSRTKEMGMSSSDKQPGVKSGIKPSSDEQPLSSSTSYCHILRISGINSDCSQSRTLCRHGGKQIIIQRLVCPRCISVIVERFISQTALQLANGQRNAYGLRYNDFTRYRKHCANRTHRLRSTLKMTHGKGREFKKLPPLSTENIKDGQCVLHQRQLL